MSNSRGTFKDYLFNLKSQNQDHTHTRIGSKDHKIYGGSYTIINENAFYKKYYNHIFVNGKKEYLTEKQIENGQILIDLDFRYTNDVKERQHNDEHFEDLIDLYIDKLQEIFIIKKNIRFPVFVLEKPNVNCLKDKTKDGIHIIIGLKMSNELQLLLREKVLEKINECLNDLPLQNNYESVLDLGISKGTTNWQLFGSRKPGNERYQLVAYYDLFINVDDDLEREVYDIENPENNFILDLLPKISARNTKLIEFEIKEEVLKELEILNEKKAKKKTKPRVKKPKIIKKKILNSFEGITSQETLDETIDIILKEANENDKYYIQEAFDYTMALSNKFYEPYDKWIEIGWTLYCIDDIMFPIWIKFSAQSADFSYDKIPEFYEKWENMENKGLTIGTLIFYLREDNFKKYKEIKEKTVSYYLNEACKSEAEYDIAMILYKLFGDEYICCSIKNNVWYKYKNNKWIETEGGIALKKKISKNLHTIFIKKQQSCLNKLPMIVDEKKREDIQNYIQKVAELAIKLKKTSWKHNIMKEAEELFYNKDFFNKLDKNPNILCFKNGVIDFENGVTFRKGRPSDYLSLCTNINYVPYNKENEEHKKISDEIKTFFKQLFTNNELRKYMWEHLASTLWGKNLNQTFNMYIGCGRNGKSKLVEFMGEILGDYKGTVPIGLVTQKRTAIGSASPEIAQLRGLRYAVMQEPSKGMVLNEGVMKELTGGDPLQGRLLFKDTVTFIPQFSLVVCMNHLFDIKADDDGTWRRIRVCNFESKFVKKPSDNEEDKEFLVDPKIDTNFKKWREIAASMFIEIIKRTKGVVKDCENVILASQNYKASQDHFTGFFKERIVKCSGLECNHCRNNNCSMKKRDLLENFKDWYSELYGIKCPKGKDLYDFLNKKIGKPSKNSYKGYKLLDPDLDFDDDDNFNSNNI